ncbi:MAG: hypothetical protein WAQ28_14880 [Bacteroidia bacterium]|jgi:hypothetical protein
MLQKIIHQLNERDYTLLSMQMEKTKAEKYLTLLNNYRNEKATDKELLIRMKLNSPTFYTLKSRLFEKIQYFLFKNIEETRTELIKNVAKIEHLVYNMPRETSIPILKKLEAELIKNDMPNELISVYKALKKVHLNTSKHYDYSLLYNKYVAYNLAQDKAEEILSSFCQTLGMYYLNREQLEYNKLGLFKKEMENVCRLYDSHRLKLYKNILTIQYALFIPGIEQDYDNIQVEQLLSESTGIIEKFKDDKVYKHLVPVMDYLNFEYYSQLKLQKNAMAFYKKIAARIDILLLFNHTCFTSHFLISKIGYSHAETIQFDEADTFNYPIPTPDDLPNYVLHCYNRTI